jgi:mono/diheme cytochrome c family protein
MPFRQILLGFFAAFVLAILAGFVWTWRPAIAPIGISDRPSVDEQTFRHGAELAAIGNCNDCHAAESGKPYAGGRSIPTPFGTIFSSNITPDAETGMGAWSEAAFRRAMHEGVDREGRQLYPAFPYDHFTKATNDDVRALYAFLMSQPPVHNEIPANRLTFPFNFRPIISGWKVLFLHEAPLQQDDSKSAGWNRGRYLAEGLGHCGACHTPRNILGAEKKNSAYDGGAAEGWDAPPLNLDSLAAHKWTADQLTEYLSTGWHRLHGAAAGPMADVTHNLAQASTQDVRAMAVYIASLSAQSENANNAVAPRDGNQITGASAEVTAIYAGACANCHNDRNDVGPSKAVSLSLSSAVRQPGSANTVRVILQGIQPQSGAAGAYMPAFDRMFTDQQIASLAEYVRARYMTHSPLLSDVSIWIGIAFCITQSAIFSGHHEQVQDRVPT